MKKRALQVNRFLFDHRKYEKTLPSPKVQELKRVLILRLDDKLGDMVVNTILLRELHSASPDIKIDVVGGKQSLSLLEGSPHVSNLISFRKGLFPVLFLGEKLRRGQYDFILDLRPLTDARTVYLLWRSGARYVLSLAAERLNLVNCVVEGLPQNLSMWKKQKKILEYFHISPKSLRYELFLGEAEVIKVKNLLPEGRTLILLNVFAGARYRSFSSDSLFRILEGIQECLTDMEAAQTDVILVAPPGESLWLQARAGEWMRRGMTLRALVLPPAHSIREVVALAKQVHLVITPDTSMVHIASAWNKPLIAFYRTDAHQSEKNREIWAPNCDHYRTVTSHGFNHNKTELDINTFASEDFRDAFKGLWSHAKKGNKNPFKQDVQLLRN